MVRINIIDPVSLSDQHLVAEYNEILVFFGFVKKHPNISNVPVSFCLGTGHIGFFRNKLVYLKKRFESLKSEMLNRGFKPVKSVSLDCFSDELLNDWKPKNKDFGIIKERISEKLLSKPGFYKYYGTVRSPGFFMNLMG